MESLLVKTYDIVDCGPRHRYAVNGKIVSNSSTGIQLHNLRRDVFDDPEPMIQTILARQPVEEPTKALSRLVRAVISHPKSLTWVDYSNIEGRMAPWLEGTELGEAKLNVFREGIDPYKVNAAGTFGVDYSEVSKTQRQAGKVQELACIQEGTLVKCKRGDIPIEQVRPGDLVWDGGDWVVTDGAIYRGERYVIEYDGLRATADHLVWVEGQADPVEFEVAAVTGLRLQTGERGGLHTSVPPTKSASYFSQTEMRKPEIAGLQKLWGTGNTIRVQFSFGSVCLGRRKPRPAPTEYGLGSHRQQPRLQTGEFALVNKDREPSAYVKDRQYASVSQISPRLSARSVCGQHFEKLAVNGVDVQSDRGTVEPPKLQAKRRVWDLLNCGQFHRFTASGKLVHNCQFGGGVGALQVMGRAYGLEISEDYGKTLRDGWRTVNPWMAAFGRKLEKAVRAAIKAPETWHEAGRVAYAYDGTDWLWCKLPSGRLLAYHEPKFEMTTTPWGEEMMAVTALWGGSRPKVGEPWPRRPLIAGLLIENCTQAASACLLRDALRKCDERGIEVVMHVHDEIVAQNVSKEDLRAVLLDTPAWAAGLPVQASAESGVRYGK